MRKELEKVKTPTLVLHGEADQAVPLSDAKQIYDAIGGEKKLKIIFSGNWPKPH